MFKARRTSVLVIGAMAAVAIGGGAAFAASGGDDDTVRPSRVAVADSLASPSPSASSDDDWLDDSSPSASPSASPSPSATRSAASGGSSSGGSSSAGISATQAKSIALKAAGGGRVDDIERETEHGRAVWDVEVQRGNVEHDIDIDRKTGEVVRHKTDRDDDDRDDRHGDDD